MGSLFFFLFLLLLLPLLLLGSSVLYGLFRVRSLMGGKVSDSSFFAKKKEKPQREKVDSDGTTVFYGPMVGGNDESRKRLSALKATAKSVEYEELGC